MTQRQIKLVENYIRLKVKKVLSEKRNLRESKSTEIQSKIYQAVKGMDTNEKNKFVVELINFLDTFKQ